MAWRSGNPDDSDDAHYGEKERSMDCKRQKYQRLEEASYKRNRFAISDAEQLLESSWFGDLKAVKRLLRKGVPPTSRSKRHLTFHPNSTPLMAAAQNGHLEVAKLLLSWGSKVEATDDYGHTALMWSVWSNEPSVPMVALLLRKGGNPNRHGNGGWTPLIRAAKYGHPEIVRLLLRYGADATARASNGEPALHFAKLHADLPQNVACVRLLAPELDDAGPTSMSAAALIEHYEKLEGAGMM